jgi:salicylate hydroxylase
MPETDPIGAEPIIVAGAGIGGLTAALALARRGFTVIVLERRTVLDEAGAGIQLSPNASRVLTGLGLGPALARQSSEPPRVVIRSRQGRPIGTKSRRQPAPAPPPYPSSTAPPCRRSPTRC